MGRLNRKKIQRLTAIIIRFRIDKVTNKIYLQSSDPCVQCNKLLYHAGIRKIFVPDSKTNTLIAKKVEDPEKKKIPFNFSVAKYMKETPTFLNSMYRGNKKKQKKCLKRMGFRGI